MLFSRLVLVVLLMLVLVSSSQAVPAGGNLVLVNERFNCGNYPQPIDFDRVEVHLDAAFTQNIKVPVWFGQHGKLCAGRIGELVASTVFGDMVKVTKGANGLIVERGYLECRGKSPAVHQDGVQAQGGQNVTFRYLNVRCPTSNHSSFFVNSGSTDPADWPRAIVCEFCTLDGGGTTVHIGHSYDSGVRDSYIRQGAFYTFRDEGNGVGVVNERNTIVAPGAEMPYLLPIYPQG